MKLSWILSLWACTAAIGCKSPDAALTMGGRPESMTVASVRNPFLGSWGMRPGDSINDWTVVFGSDGAVAVRGPGLEEQGRYISVNKIARARFTTRAVTGSMNGAQSTSEFIIDPVANRLEFSTGIPNDPPVKLVRRSARASKSTAMVAAL